MATKITAAERLATIRKEAKEIVPIPEDRFQIDTDTYAFKTATGYAKVTISGTKPDFDPEYEQEMFFMEREVAAQKKADTKKKAEADKLAREKAKANKEAAKATKGKVTEVAPEVAPEVEEDAEVSPEA